MVESDLWYNFEFPLHLKVVGHVVQPGNNFGARFVDSVQSCASDLVIAGKALNIT